MEQFINEFISPSKQYKAQVIKRTDGLYTTEVFMWQEDSGYKFWSQIKEGMSLVDTEERAIESALDKLRQCSGEIING
ncbi:hypothetical protein E3U55_16360 [Filobacillus milosensis]|uniref:Uncharacterized protein n=1 Tax=Filobacillus milosensis TaxID=94137 RepID=A0A4Y8II77_9BACI|nr:hypothetical protein [Filobacillus milosensis]TFB13303.1 hypothetical protein E3U55_16360 [Filobacillus milosensis]